MLEYSEIVSIEDCGVEETYDITMEDWPSFVADEIVVHNSGMTKLLKDMAVGGPLTFNDLCAATALFRPGPLDAGLCDRYVQVKQGASQPHYDHPSLEECLSETFGVLTYQEQVMKLTRQLCGFTPGEADGVRKAIGKKDADKMAEYGDRFVNGAMAGEVEIEMDDGTTRRFHALHRFVVKGNALTFTAQECMDQGLEIVL